MSDAKRDTRPQGALELQAGMYAGWNRALFIMQHAASAGHHVELLDITIPKLGMSLNAIEVRP